MTKENAQALLEAVVEQVGRYLGADRCFLYLRQPSQRHGRIAVQWRRNDRNVGPNIPDVIQPDWQPDTDELPQEDPLFRAAITGQPSVYVADVETADPNVLNRDFENHTFGHRALIHAHVWADGQLWGILQPCVFGQPRIWTTDDRTYIEKQLPGLVAPIRAFVSE